ncbi:MAG: glycosyltransferase family 4 protein [Candidatus Bathyarchaeia archaeon]
MKKRIGVIMYQTSKSKGQELVAQRMVSYFRRLGHEAFLITSVYHDEKEVIAGDLIGEKGYVQIDDVELKIPIIRVASFTTQWPPRRIVFKDQVQILERIVDEFKLNVLITHSTLWNGPEEVAKFVEWRRNIKSLGGFQYPLVFCHMSHYQEPSPRRYSIIERSFRMAWNKLSLGVILRVANLILVVTPFEEEAKAKMGVRKEKFILFPGGIDDYTFMSLATSNPDELLQRLKLRHDTKIVTYVGTIEERKNPKAILEAADRLRDRTDIHFVIAGGGGDSELAEQVRRRAEELPNVTYLGEINDKEKVQLIEISYLNILLSRLEALGITQLEFMFRGVPVVTSGVGGQSWIVRNGQDGVQVDGPDDVEGAATAIVELADDPAKWQKLSANAKERASEFTLTKLVQELDEAITKELERESGQANLPPEVKSTLGEPETILRTWSHGTRKVAVTDRRFFIQQGKLSRSTFEIPYSAIKSIEHVRRYAWKTLLIGGALSFLIFIQHFVFPIISRTLTSRIVLLTTSVLPGIKIELLRFFTDLWLLPITITFLIFLVQARKGYALHGASIKPILLPASFKEAIEYIRKMLDEVHQNQNLNAKSSD